MIVLTVLIRLYVLFNVAVMSLVKYMFYYHHNLLSLYVVQQQIVPQHNLQTVVSI